MQCYRFLALSVCRKEKESGLNQKGRKCLWLKHCVRQSGYNFWLSYLAVTKLCSISSPKPELSELQGTSNAIYFMALVICILAAQEAGMELKSHPVPEKCKKWTHISLTPPTYLTPFILFQ